MLGGFPPVSGAVANQKPRLAFGMAREAAAHEAG